MSSISFSQITAAQAVKEMRKGINLGNTFDAPCGETCWGQPETMEHFFDDYVEQGITAVRIPITWDEHLGKSSPYAIDPEFLNRVEKVVDWGLSKGLYILINTHHDWWIRENYGDQSKKDRFASLWTQICSRFKNKSYKLLFEIVNEPHGMSVGDLNDLQFWTTDLIRKSGGNNNKRIIVFAGNEYSDALNLAQIAVPSNDHTYMIGNFHCYTPWDWMSGSHPTWNQNWGEPQEKFNIAVNWARANNVEVMLNEYGVINNKDYESRMEWFRCYTKYINDYNFAAFIWDNGGDFEAYSKKNRSFWDWVDIVTQPLFSKKGSKAVAWYNKSGSVRRLALNTGEYYAADIQSNDWMSYRINVPKTMKYIFEAQIASPYSTGVMSLEKYGGTPVFGKVNVPNTGGWGVWNTIKDTIDLTAGELEFTITATQGGFNLMKIRLFEIPTPVTGIKLKQDSINLALNDSTKLEYQILPLNGTNNLVTWVSSDVSVVKVKSDGTIIGLKNGSTQIIVTTEEGNFKDTLTVSVYKQKVMGIQLSPKKLTLESGKTQQLTPIFTPVNASDKSVTYISNNIAIATVNENGVVLGLAEGTTTITAKSLDGSFSDVCSLTVTKATVLTYRLKNRWKEVYLFDKDDRVAYGPFSSEKSYQWVLEEIDNAKRIKNYATGNYMSIENQTGYIECGSISTDWESAKWIIEKDENNYVRIKNQWQQSHYIHIENQKNQAQHGQIDPTWWSVQWALEEYRDVASTVKPPSKNSFANIEVYPNYNQNYIHIKTNNVPIKNIKILDITGKVLQESIHLNSNGNFDISDYSSGMYILNFSTQTGTINKKIIKQ